MPLHLALLLSLGLHAALIAIPAWLEAAPAPRQPQIEARLLPLPPTQALADAVSTLDKADAAAPRAEAARRDTAKSLRRTQTAFSKHLFYPPEAVAQGLEGEVILLLTLGESGRLATAEVARSSGHALLDRAALDAARRIGALPGNPRQMLFPVSFRLN